MVNSQKVKLGKLEQGVAYAADSRILAVTYFTLCLYETFKDVLNTSSKKT